MRFLAAQRNVYRFALELRLLERQNGPLVAQKEAVAKLAAKYLYTVVEWDDDACVLKTDELRFQKDNPGWKEYETPITLEEDTGFKLLPLAKK